MAFVFIGPRRPGNRAVSRNGTREGLNRVDTGFTGTKKRRPDRAAPGAYCFFSYFLRNRSIRPAVSINFCLPV
jgi:hypothetical protein